MRERILEISKESGNSHIGSSLGVYDTLKAIEPDMIKGDKIFLDAAHGSLGYFVWLEETSGYDAVKLQKEHGTHQHRAPEHGILASGGSLGLVSSIALGHAIADRSKTCWLITSDGSMAEGIQWEVLRLKADLKVDNLKIAVNANGWSALGAVDINKLEQRIFAFCPDVRIIRTNSDFEVNEGLSSHYARLD